MDPQYYSWTCSICSFTWVINSLAAAGNDIMPLTRDDAALVIGYPECVNETYGLMSAQCMIDAFATYGLKATQAWVTFAQAYTIMRSHTGVINPIGMYHFMACRGVDGLSLWVANSAPGYCGVWDNLAQTEFNNLGPVQIIYLPETSAPSLGLP